MITGHFVDAFTPILDGVVRSVEAFQMHMRRTLGPSYVVAPSHPGHHDDDRHIVRYLSLPFRPPYRMGLPWLSPNLVGRLSKLPLDIVHTHGPFGSGHLAQAVARRRRVPLVFTLASRYPEWVQGQYQRTPTFAALLALSSLAGRSAGRGRLAPRDLF